MSAPVGHNYTASAAAAAAATWVSEAVFISRLSAPAGRARPPGFLQRVALYRAERLCDGTFVSPICPSAHVSSGKTADWIWMPFGVVSGFGLTMGVLDFGGDC